jgi:hypothetical protein
VIVSRGFKSIAKLSSGAYSRFTPPTGELPELLRSVDCRLLP